MTNPRKEYENIEDKNIVDEVSIDIDEERDTDEDVDIDKKVRASYCQQVAVGVTLNGLLILGISSVGSLAGTVFGMNTIAGVAEQVKTLIAQAVNETVIAQLEGVETGLDQAQNTEMGSFFFTSTLTAVGLGLAAFGLWQSTKKSANEHAAQQRPNETTPFTSPSR